MGPVSALGRTLEGGWLRHAVAVAGKCRWHLTLTQQRKMVIRTLANFVPRGMNSAFADLKNYREIPESS